MMPLKRKVVTISLSLSTFLVMGTAYAYSEASTPLQTWFKAQLFIHQQAIDSKLQQEIVTVRQALDESGKESVERAGVQLEKVTVDTGYKVVSSIDTAQQAYADQLERASILLSKSSRETFDRYIQTSTNQMSNNLTQWADETIQGLTAKLGD
ncbi:hypothetical protein [Paenibacillus qinlingensis]|uniref:Membrane protein n=1 Tax=Paenibacillus qinlingensis TaxID=1837343 RepID=A0ABU1P4R9_9BACL|nr:hypothetical protein [Paenibacillus qinlingensis]MDR6554222.1 putative membrane protein [Paenibacillus qinlingensis]